MNRVFVDLDGVVADFDKLKTALGISGDEMKRLPGIFLQIEPIPGALAAIASLEGMGFEVWIATKPPTGYPQAYADKVQWILTHMPQLKRRIILTHDKGLLGDSGDFLIDDRPHKANCERFKGTLVHFTTDYHWPRVLDFMRLAAA